MAELRYVDWDGLVYYDGKIKKHIEDKLENCIKMGGEVSPRDLPSPSMQNLNYIYKLTDEFTADENFEESIRGYIYQAGTWVQVTDLDGVYLYTIFSETSVTPVGPDGVDLSNYYTKAEIDRVILSLDNAVRQLDASVKDITDEIDALKDGKSDIGHKHTLADITDYSEPDLSKFATKEYVDSVVKPNDVDLSNYYTKDETNTAISDAIRGIDIPDTTDMATTTWVNEQGFITNVDDKADVEHTHDEYMTTDEANATFAKVTDIPDTGMFATTEQLSSLESDISETYVTNATIEENYITKDEISNTYVTNNYVSENYLTSEDAEKIYVTETEVNSVVKTEVQTVIQEKIDAGEITVNTDSISYDTW